MRDTNDMSYILNMSFGNNINNIRFNQTTRYTDTFLRQQFRGHFVRYQWTNLLIHSSHQNFCRLRNLYETFEPNVDIVSRRNGLLYRKVQHFTRNQEQECFSINKRQLYNEMMQVYQAYYRLLVTYKRRRQNYELLKVSYMSSLNMFAESATYPLNIEILQMHRNFMAFLNDRNDSVNGYASSNQELDAFAGNEPHLPLKL